jgi:hypothetical protein
MDNQVGEFVSIYFFTVPTSTFRVRFVLMVLAHARRRIINFNVMEHPTAEWTAQQMVEAFCDGESSRPGRGSYPEIQVARAQALRR